MISLLFAQVVPAGPGETLNDFRTHFEEAHGRPPAVSPSHGIASQPDADVPAVGAAGSSALPLRSTPDSNTNVASITPIVAFLNEQNLPISLAPALDALGISDSQRMRALGALPESALDKLEKGLEERGIGLVERLLIVDGLRRRAAHPGKTGS